MAADWSNELRTKNLKATPNRVVVLETIAGNNAAMAYSKIQSDLSQLDRVTLYRTLNSLVDNGLIHKVLVEENEAFYATCSSNCSSEEHHHQHVHFRCTNCKEVTCVSSQPINQLEIPGYLVQNFEIQATGVCNLCL